MRKNDESISFLFSHRSSMPKGRLRLELKEDKYQLEDLPLERLLQQEALTPPLLGCPEMPQKKVLQG